MNEYISYEDLQDDALGANDTFTPSTADIAELRAYCALASRMFDGACKRFFYPVIDTLEFDHPDDDTWLSVKPHDLLEVSTFTTANTGTTVTSGQYYLMCGGSYNHTPYNRIVMKSNSTRPNLLYSGTVQQANAVTGAWGYHEDWTNAWQDSADTLQAAIETTTAASITVADADGTDIYGVLPRFKVQQLIKIDSEYLYVTAKNTTTNVLTVRRGVNGSTAATHDNGSTVYVYRVMEDVETATRALAKWLYDRRAASYSDESAMVDASGTTRLPASAPQLVRWFAKVYKRRDVG